MGKERSNYIETELRSNTLYKHAFLIDTHTHTQAHNLQKDIQIMLCYIVQSDLLCMHIQMSFAWL